MKKMNNKLPKLTLAFLMLFLTFSCSVSETDNPEKQEIAKQEIPKSNITARVSRSWGIDPT